MKTNKVFEDEKLDLSKLWERLDRTPPGAIISRTNGKAAEVKSVGGAHGSRPK